MAEVILLLYVFQVAGGLHPVNLIALSLSLMLFVQSQKIFALFATRRLS